MNQKINGNGCYNTKNVRQYCFKSKSPKLKSNLIQKNINERNNKDKNNNFVFNNNSVKKIKLDKNIFMIKNNHEKIKENTNLEQKKENPKKENINIQDVIDNEINKYLINNKQNKKPINNTQKENKNIKENIKETDLIKKEEGQIPEDISDYINVNEKEYNLNDMNKITTNEAIEEVEEAKEMSELKQPSEIMRIVSNSKPSKSSAKNSDLNKNKTELGNQKYNKLNLKNNCCKLSLNKRFQKKINVSPGLKRIEIGFPKYESKHETSYKNIRKNYFKLNNIDIIKYNNNNNIENYLIFEKNNDLVRVSEIKPNYIIIGKNKKDDSNNQIKKIHINQRNKNIFDLNKNNKSNIILKDLKGNHEALKNVSKAFINSNNSAKTTPNIKNINNGKKIIKSNKISTDSQSDINSNINIKIKIREKISPFTSRYIYNNKLKSLSKGSNRKKKINNNTEISKFNKHKKIIIFDDEEKKLNKTSDYDLNASSQKYLGFNKNKLTINKIKNSEEKYHKLFTDYHLRQEKSKNRALIKETLINKRKHN